MKIIATHGVLVRELFEVRQGFITKAAFYRSELQNTEKRLMYGTIYHPTYLRMICHLNGEKNRLNTDYKEAVQKAIDEYITHVSVFNNDLFCDRYHNITQIFLEDIA